MRARTVSLCERSLRTLRLCGTVACALRLSLELILVIAFGVLHESFVLYMNVEKRIRTVCVLLT